MIDVAFVLRSKISLKICIDSLSFRNRFSVFLCPSMTTRMCHKRQDAAYSSDRNIFTKRRVVETRIGKRRLWRVSISCHSTRSPENLFALVKTTNRCHWKWSCLSQRTVPPLSDDSRDSNRVEKRVPLIWLTWCSTQTNSTALADEQRERFSVDVVFERWVPRLCLSSHDRWISSGNQSERKDGVNQSDVRFRSWWEC